VEILLGVTPKYYFYTWIICTRAHATVWRGETAVVGFDFREQVTNHNALVKAFDRIQELKKDYNNVSKKGEYRQA
jgi:hypothetical protein